MDCPLVVVRVEEVDLRSVALEHQAAADCSLESGSRVLLSVKTTFSAPFTFAAPFTSSFALVATVPTPRLPVVWSMKSLLLPSASPMLQPGLAVAGLLGSRRGFKLSAQAGLGSAKLL